MRVPFELVYVGTDAFSVSVLQSILPLPKVISKIHVVTPPDRYVVTNSRRICHVPPLRTFAQTVPLLTHSSIEPSNLSHLAENLHNYISSPSSLHSLLVTASFGHLIPAPLIDAFPPNHAINIHPSLLPRYRGAAPIERTIINGDKSCGVTIQTLNKTKFDAGLVLSQRKYETPPECTTPTLSSFLAKQAGELLIDTLSDFDYYKENAYTQDTSKIVPAPKSKKQHGRIDLKTMSASQILRLDRALSHRFPLYLSLNNKPIHLKLFHPSPQQLELIHQHMASKPSLPLGSASLIHLAQVHPAPLLCISTLSSSSLPSSSSSPSSSSLSPQPSPSSSVDSQFLLVSQLRNPSKPFITAVEFWNGHSRSRRLSSPLPPSLEKHDDSNAILFN